MRQLIPLTFGILIPWLQELPKIQVFFGPSWSVSPGIFWGAVHFGFRGKIRVRVSIGGRVSF